MATFAGQQILNLRELVVRGEDLRRLRVSQRRESGRHDLIGEPVDCQDLHSGQGCLEAPEQERSSLLPCGCRPDHQRHALRIGALFHQTSESLSKHPRLAGPGSPGGQQGAAVVVEYAGLIGIGLHGHRGHAIAGV